MLGMFLDIKLFNNSDDDSDKKQNAMKKDIKRILQGFVRKLYESFFNNAIVNLLFRIMEEAGIFSEMIKVYPTLEKSSESYEKTFKNI